MTEAQTTPTRPVVEFDGWRLHDLEDDAVHALRQYLLEHNGIHGLEIFTSDQVDSITRVFHRDGFVVVRDVVDIDTLARIKEGVEEVAASIVALDPEGKGVRMAGRYSFGGCSTTRSMLHHPAWQALLEIDSIHTLVEAIFRSPHYMLRAASGDFCIPGAAGYQPLHADMGNYDPGRPSPFAAFQDPNGVMDYRDLPTPYIAVNLLVDDATPLNGPTRQIPGTQNSRVPIPSLDEEPQWMRVSTVCPAPAGTIQIRDVRAWHGGTPNLSDRLRAIPNLEFYAPWFREPLENQINRRDWEHLSDRAKRLTRQLVADSSEDLQPGLALAQLSSSRTSGSR